MLPMIVENRVAGHVLVALGALALVAAFAACDRSDGDTELGPAGPGADSAVESVQTLVDALSAGNFDDAAPLAVTGHAALATLAEGATFGQVAEALRSEDSMVAANFWGGFAQGTGAFLTGQVEVSGDEQLEKDGIVYHLVNVTPETGEQRVMMARDEDGFRIDLFASFAPGLAQRMVGPVERLLTAQTPDSRLVLAELKATVPSLLVAAEKADQPPDVVQSVLRLVEMITRVG